MAAASCPVLVVPRGAGVTPLERVAGRGRAGLRLTGNARSRSRLPSRTRGRGGAARRLDRARAPGPRGGRGGHPRVPRGAPPASPGCSGSSPVATDLAGGGPLDGGRRLLASLRARGDPRRDGRSDRASTSETARTMPRSLSRWRTRSRERASARSCSPTSRRSPQRTGSPSSGPRCMPQNHRMIEVFRESGFPVETSSEPGAIRVELPTSLRRERGRPLRGPRPARGHRGASLLPRARGGRRDRSLPQPRTPSAASSSTTCSSPASRASSIPSTRARTWFRRCTPTGASRTCPEDVELAVIAVPAAARDRRRARSAASGACGRWSSSRPASPRRGRRGPSASASCSRSAASRGHATGRPELPRHPEHRSRPPPQRDLRPEHPARRRASASSARAALSGSP